jgi:hypothetical protein
MKSACYMLRIILLFLLVSEWPVALAAQVFITTKKGPENFTIASFNGIATIYADRNDDWLVSPRVNIMINLSMIGRPRPHLRMDKRKI